MTRWKTETCFECNGSGMRMVYGPEGPDHVDDCYRCNAGTVWVSEKDRLAMWPGGPFVGYEPGRFAELPANAEAIRDD